MKKWVSRDPDQRQTPSPENIRAINRVAPPELRIRLDVEDGIAVPSAPPAGQATITSIDGIVRDLTVVRGPDGRLLSDEELDMILRLRQAIKKP